MEPVARRQDVIVQEVDRQTMVFDSTTAEFHLLNDVAAFVFRHADGRTTSAQLAERARAALGGELEVEDVEGAVAELDRVNLLQREPGAPARRLPRREAVRRLGVTAAIALPFVTSMVAPPPAMAASDSGHGRGQQREEEEEEYEKEDKDVAKDANGNGIEDKDEYDD